MTCALINGSKVIYLCITFNLSSFYFFPFCPLWSKRFMCTTCILWAYHRRWKRNALPFPRFINYSSKQIMFHTMQHFKATQGQSSYQCKCRGLVWCQSIHNSCDDEITKYSETRRGSEYSQLHFGRVAIIKHPREIGQFIYMLSICRNYATM